MLPRLLMLLLDLAFISGQIESDTRTKVAVLNTTKSHNISHHLDFKETSNDTDYFPESEEFMDLENKHLHYSNCDEQMFMEYGKELCMAKFDTDMRNLGQENWCDWEMVLGDYNSLTQCLEISASLTHCYYPNAQVQAIFVDVHKIYFITCGSKEDPLPDAPARVVLVLTLLPVSVIPVLVYMVIWKSSVID